MDRLYLNRWAKARKLMEKAGIGSLLLVPTTNLFYLTAQKGHTNDRISCFLLTASEAFFICPGFEKPRANKDLLLNSQSFVYSDGEEPCKMLADLIAEKGDSGLTAVDTRIWGGVLLSLQQRLPKQGWVDAAEIITPLRMQKDEEEYCLLKEAQRLAGLGLAELYKWGLEGRSEKEAALKFTEGFFMSIKLFWEDTYSARNDARVTSVEGDVITVDRTVAFAFPGGQVFDTGNIGGKPILDARYDKEKLEVYYTLPQDHGLKTGDTVTVEIGWDRRYALMKLHFIAELAIVVLRNHYGRHKLYRADILPEKAVLGFEWETDIAEAFPLLEAKLKELIAQDISIISNWEDQAAEKRYWEIPGLAKVPCGGTHLKKTGEIGSFRLKKASPGSGKAEFEMYLIS